MRVKNKLNGYEDVQKWLEESEIIADATLYEEYLPHAYLHIPSLKILCCAEYIDTKKDLEQIIKEAQERIKKRRQSPE